jgi:hypothetical protein
MILTEEEARSKWCCASFGLLDAISDAAGHRYPARCEASECMAWRWWGVWPNGEAKDTLYVTSLVVGYCGLARRPEEYPR